VRPLAQGLNETTHVTDAKAFIGWLDQQSSVAKNLHNNELRVVASRPRGRSTRQPSQRARVYPLTRSRIRAAFLKPMPRTCVKLALSAITARSSEPNWITSR
jgi:hypothetical protein